MSETTYAFTFRTTQPVPADEQHEGTLADALRIAEHYDATIELADEAGFRKGRVHADGRYTLT
jgi:hypothetical protein